MKKKIITIAGVQNAVGSDMQKNIEKTAKLVEKAVKAGAQIICLQELFDVLYFPQKQGVSKDMFAETVPGRATNVFKAIAKKYGVVIVAPIYQKIKTKSGKCDYFNSAVVIDEKGKFLKTYHKVHIPHDPGFYEKDYFKQSDIGYRVYKTKFGTFAVLICYDQWFPEAARAVRLLGAEMIFYPTAIGDIVGYKPDEDWHDAWETVQRSHAIANSVYVMAVNRVGVEGKMKFFGQSFISDPFGKVLKLGSKDKEEIIMAKIDLSRNKYISDGWGFMRNRRPESYKILTKNILTEKSTKLKKVEHYKDAKKFLGEK